MKKKVKIINHPQMLPGSAQRLLREITPAPISVDDEGNPSAELAEHELAQFRARGGAHQVIVEPDPAPEVETIQAQPDPSPTTDVVLKDDIEGMQEIQAWRDATECDTPADFLGRMSDLESSIKSQMDAWRDATKCDTPQEAAGRIEELRSQITALCDKAESDRKSVQSTQPEPPAQEGAQGDTSQT